MFYWKRWKFDLANVCAQPCADKDCSYGRGKISSGLRTVSKAVGLTGLRYFRELNSDEIVHI